MSSCDTQSRAQSYPQQFPDFFNGATIVAQLLIAPVRKKGVLWLSMAAPNDGST